MSVQPTDTVSVRRVAILGLAVIGVAGAVSACIVSAASPTVGVALVGLAASCATGIAGVCPSTRYGESGAAGKLKGLPGDSGG